MTLRITYPEFKVSGPGGPNSNVNPYYSGKVVKMNKIKMNKSSQVKPENLCFISMETLFRLADEKQSVWWTSRKMLWSAAFFQNWNARQLKRWLENGWIMGVRRGELMGERKCNHQWQYNVGNPMVPLICMKCNFIPEPKEVFK